MIDRVVSPIVALPRVVKRAIALATDAGMSIFTVWFAFYLRLGVFVPLSGSGWPAAILSLAVLPIFWWLGLYRTVFRHVGAETFAAIVQAVFVYGVLFSCIITAFGIEGVPRTVGIIQPILMVVAVLAVRVFGRYFLSGEYRQRARARKGRSVLIYGAGSAGRQLAAALIASKEMRPVGFVDDDRSLRGSLIGGLHVSGPERLSQLVESLHIDEILLAIPSAGRKRRNELLEIVRGLGIAVRTLPDLLDIAHGTVAVSDLRPLEVEDLLGRDPVSPDLELMRRNVLGKCVLVTGAGGSIGSELCRQVWEIGPRLLLLVDVSEFALYEINRELGVAAATQGRDDDVVALFGSVCDAARMREILSIWRPDTIYHAAAYKHVPLVEHNVVDGVRNNVLGTWTLAQAAIDYRVSAFVLISTDKAVRPTNVMGASKRVAELTLQALATESSETCFSMVRFGNVLGSSGSVVPLFRQQIAAGGPVTVTHQDITRYFMTIPEAAQLVIQAGAMARGGEVFVLDMGEPVRIFDLARRMIDLSGMGSDDQGSAGAMDIVFTGLRPGEKLYEELLIGDSAAQTQHPRVLKADEQGLAAAAMRELVSRLNASILRRDSVAVLTLLREAVAGYQPSGSIVDWTELRPGVKVSDDEDMPKSRPTFVGL